MSDCGFLRCLLGMKIQLNENKILISEEASVAKLLYKFFMVDCLYGRCC